MNIKDFVNGYKSFFLYLDLTLAETKKSWHFQVNLVPPRSLSAQSLRSKFKSRFSDVPEVNHSILEKKLSKNTISEKRRLEKQTVLDFFIAHWDLSNEYSIDPKAI